MSGKFALIIGNTEYTDPGLAQLTAPSTDTEDFARVLKDQNLCGFDDVKILLNQLSSSVIEAIDEFFDQKKHDDMLVLYFSGHGIKDEIGSLYLSFKNTIRTRLRATAVKSDYIREAMDQSRSKRQVLILDCCNSGAFPPGTKAEVGGAMGLSTAFQGYGRFVLTASNAIQFAWEGNQLIGETKNSLFTHFLVKGLEGEADNDGDGRITVDELYDYAFEQISRITPKQTPTKSATKQEGEIVLRQFTRIEDIKPVPLPDELISEIEDLRPFVREAAVQRLEKILKGKNIGMMRSAIEALEKVAADENTTRRVAQAAMQALESVRQAEQLKMQTVEEERKAREEAERIAILKAEEERIARERVDEERKAREELERRVREKVEAEWKAQEEAKRLAAQKAEEERITRAKIEGERLAEEKRLATEKAEAERRAREQAERKTKEDVERLAEENQLVLEKAKEEAEAERKARENTERLTKQKVEEKTIEPERATIKQVFNASTLLSKWVPTIWIALSWSLGFLISTNIDSAVGYAICGATGGFVTAFISKREKILADWKSVLWITLSWSIGLAISWLIVNNIPLFHIENIGFTIGIRIFRIFGYAPSPEEIGFITSKWVIGGLIGGFATATIIRISQVISDWKKVSWITLGWPLGMAIGAISWTIAIAISKSNGMGAMVGGAIGGAIGGLVMIWQMRKRS
jgi:hypothetical protein